ncbi:hypothetical protein G6F57_005937 [Rhizopus arrhizus]|uniref:BHLH domain-containing protein n=1 Tax=Rhizopus oryzae TaxID=64495 RepID=A0A9P6XBR6_RHIOR|nr:hypothetical protein G6F23_008323 [Rhizopus arrhizus]KAG1422148.1 hypothetical protein G6F58_003437 [Rhizopus delemar]KAG0764804.1 hypothetical protein G6F24_004931 [Rhizopus arrhizus]KAG0781100.1 hypothetical protein G6F22_009736 [Rhizopus arrhizus]KAG0786251.1 hypothetical protein G6F21_008723 [Rhizopus arrhizus]
MSEIVLSNTTYDYSSGSMMVDIDPGLKTTTTADEKNEPPVTTYEESYSTYPGYSPPYAIQRLGYLQEKVQPTSPESSLSPSPSPSPPHFHPSHPELMSPIDTKFSNPTTARVKEMIDRANAVPVEFYHTEFLEYSKETYEKKMESKRHKRKRTPSAQDHHNKKKKSEEDGMTRSEDLHSLSSAEMRRQIHIQSEQKRRAQIKDGFDELRKHLPGCNNKKMSKAALLTRTVQQLQHLKSMQHELLSEVERLSQENETLKKFQHGVLQRQAMEKMYTF